MPKIIIAECKQEVSTFNPQQSGYDDFAIRLKEEILRYYRGRRTEIGGALDIFDTDQSVTLIPTYSAVAITSGGTLAASSWHRISAEFLDSLRGIPDVDGIYFSMHGAMASEDQFDPEGYLLTEARKIVGERVPIVVSLDLHGVLTDRMVAQSDAIVAFHTYPHVDFFETGQRAARLLLRIVRGEVRPVTSKVAIPALVRGDELITATGKLGQTIRIAQEIEASAKGLSAAIFIGNPFTDVPALQSYGLVVTDGDVEAAEQGAVRLAGSLWSNHEQMQVPLTSLTEMAAAMNSKKPGTVALVDAADATSSGASGDSNAVLRQLIESGFGGSLLAPIVDAPAVQQAFLAGVGARITVRIGGSIDLSRFKPITINATVRMLSDGRFRSESFGEQWDSGRTAVLEADKIALVVGSRAVSLYDRSFFFANGQDPRRFDGVVVKSPHCEHHMFADWCIRTINIDAPGSTSANLRRLGHRRCRRPIFPLDAIVEYVPQSRVFHRSAP